MIDLHCHGALGVTFDHPDPDGIRRAAGLHREAGVDRLFASVVSLPADRLAPQVSLLAGLVDEGVVDGIHLEGPWLAPGRCGAHDATTLRDPSPAEVDAVLEAGRGHLRMVTLAPERPGAFEAIRRFVDAGVVVALGHTDAGPDDVRAAIDAGATHVTHLFNAMPPWRHRDPGPVPVLLAAAARGEVTLELIADGVHLADETVMAVLDLVGPDAIVLVSDAAGGTGLGDGEHTLGGVRTRVRDGVSRVVRPDGADGPIAGGCRALPQIAARLEPLLGAEVVRVMSVATPARVLG